LRDERYRALYSGLLCTIDVRNDPGATYAALAALEPPLIDFLLPHATWDSPPPDAAGSVTPYADWLIAIFDLWTADANRVPVRLFDSIVRTMYGSTSLTESMGLSASDVAVIETDGSIEQADSLKVAYDGAPDTGLDIFRNTLNEAARHPAVTARQHGLAGLCRKCRSCPVVTSCGGGLYAHRYHTETKFDNPSVYCADLMKLITHIRGRLGPVSVRPAETRPVHAIPSANLDALAAGYGDDVTIGYLAESQRSIRRALLGLVRQQMEEHALAESYADMFHQGWELITGIDGDDRKALDGVLAHPYVRAWAVHCLGQIGAPKVDAVSLAADAAHLAVIAAAAAIRSGRQVSLAVPIRDDSVYLPTLGRLPVGPGTTGTITTDCGGFELKTEAGEWSVSIAATSSPGSPGVWQPVRELRADGAVAALEDTDPYRDCHQWPAAMRLSGQLARSWQRLYREAWVLIEREHSSYAPGLAAGLSTVTPLANDKPGRDISAAARQAFGAIGSALPADEGTLALLMMHEFQHVKLGAVLDLFELYDNSEQRLFYAPWREDPRPLEALLQGTYAHIAVTDFWRVRRNYLTGQEAGNAATKFALWSRQTAAGIETLATSGSLTPLGQRFADGMRATVEPWLEEPIPQSARDVARQWAEDHRRVWSERLSPQPLRNPAGAGAATRRSSSRIMRDEFSSAPRSLVTRQDMVRDFRKLGVATGQTLLVNASLRSIGRVDDAAESVVAALREALGPEGTLVVPSGTAENSRSSREHLARISGMTRQETKEFRAQMRPFNRYITPSTEMGQVAEAVRTHPEAVRSEHPQTSFAGLGPRAAELMENHELTCHLGHESPLGKMYLRDRGSFDCLQAEGTRPGKAHPPATAWVLLLGVGFSACTAFHLSEYLYTPTPPRQKYEYVIACGSGGAQWKTYEDVVLDDSEFELLGELLDRAGLPNSGYVGDANCRLMPLCQVVDFAARWMWERRSGRQ
jgi:uncharacterized protein